MPPLPQPAQAHITRKHVRVAPHPKRPVEVQIIGAAFLDVLEARDISVGGIGVNVPHGFEGCDIRTAVQVIIKLPGKKAFMAKAVVRHVSAPKCLFGVEFTDIAERHRGDIGAYVEQMIALGRSC